MVNFGDNPERFYAQSKSDVNSDFVNRQKSVFEKLDAVVKDKEDSLVKQNNLKRNTCNEDRKVLKRQRFDTRQFLGQESIFKRPDAPLPSRFNRNIPDYKKHPQKWTKYSLSDVSEDDMSDQSNTAAAMSFLQEIKARKEAEEMEVESGRKAITFSKPSGNKKCNAANEDAFQSPIFRSSKVIMPEYVIGEKQSSKKNVRKSVGKTEKLKEIKLDHLEEEYDEES